MLARKENHGFTLIELLITLAIASILLFVGVPGFRDFIKKNGVETVSGSLKSAIVTAKTEAAGRGRSVVICGSADSASCSGNSDWSTGWIVFVDDGAGGGTAGDDSRHADETLIVARSVDGQNSISVSDGGGAADSLAFNGQGYLASESASTIKICEPDNDVSYARAVLLGVSGRTLNSRDGVDSDTTHEDSTGSNLTCP